MRHSAGIVLHRAGPEGPEVLLGHMGGPFWARKDDGAWSIPKGEYDPATEDPWDAARREFREELGLPLPDGPRLELGEIRQSGGKRVTAWAVAGDLDVDAIVPGTFELEWPPRSGRTQVFPEIDRAAWFGTEAARVKLVRAQAAFLDRLLEQLGSR
ncbi:NUDIX domain-containing protein [Conexibacter sp. W3-3-2]|nr:NUDIX domain-containing protein [Conexibacter sp. W3-3-2]MTD44472.1 NUDIX domain-containing protein [Conexibacter sp. W3-3-2]